MALMSIVVRGDVLRTLLQRGAVRRHNPIQRMYGADRPRCCTNCLLEEHRASEAARRLFSVRQVRQQTQYATTADLQQLYRAEASEVSRQLNALLAEPRGPHLGEATQVQRRVPRQIHLLDEDEQYVARQELPAFVSAQAAQLRAAVEERTEAAWSTLEAAGADWRMKSLRSARLKTDPQSASRTMRMTKEAIGSMNKYQYNLQSLVLLSLVVKVLKSVQIPLS